MTIQYYDGTNEPIPDGFRLLVFKHDPFFVLEEKTPTNERPSVKLEFRDYVTFSYNEQGVRAKHRDGHVELYMWHNILYMELQVNSEEYLAARKVWQTEHAALGHAIATHPCNFDIDF